MPGQWPNCPSRPLTICLHLWLTRKANNFSENDWLLIALAWLSVKTPLYICLLQFAWERSPSPQLQTHIHPRRIPPGSLRAVLQFSICKPVQNFCGGSIHLLSIYLFHWAINKASHKALTHRVGNKTQPVLSSSQYLLTSPHSWSRHFPLSHLWSAGLLFLSAELSSGWARFLLPVFLSSGSPQFLKSPANTIVVWEHRGWKHMIFATKQLTVIDILLERIGCIKAQLPSQFANFLCSAPAKLCIFYEVPSPSNNFLLRNIILCV